MKNHYFFYSLLLFIIFYFNISVFAQTTYTWIGANNASWATSTNWSPLRITPATTDILQFTDGTTKNITNVPTQTIGKLLINSNTKITLQSAGAITLTIGNSTGDDLVVASGSSLTIGGSNSLTITMASNATANIGGTLIVNNGRTFNTNGTSVVTTVSGTIMNSGTVSSTSAAKLVFSSGGTYQHLQNGGTIPTSTWAATSTCSITGITTSNPSIGVQTFGNFTWNCTGQSTNANFNSLFTISGNFSLNSTGTGIFRFAIGTTTINGNYFQTGGTNRLVGTVARIINVGGNFSITGGALRMSSGSATGTLNVAGNFSYSTGSLITETSSGSGSIVFNGTGNQNITGGGTISNTINFTVNNSSGITLLTSITLPSTLTMTNGNIALNGNTLTLGTSTAAKGNLVRSSGFITGTGIFTRWFSTTSISLGNVLGLFPFGNGINNRSVWIGGTPTAGGTISVQHSNLTGTTPLSFVENSQTFDKRTNMNWILSNGNGFAGTSLSLRIQGSGIPGINSVSDLNICLASSAAGGTYSAPGGTTADPLVNRTGLSQTTLANTFYFASTAASPLPVELSFFNADVQKNNVALKWETSTEVNNYGFNVERQVSSKQSAVSNWEKIGFVQGYGNSNSPKQYSYTDKNVSGGNYFYRLKQIDLDGSSKYYEKIEVTVDFTDNFRLDQNYPNPFNPSTMIKYNLPKSSKVKLVIYNSIGIQVAKLIDENQSEGAHSVNWNGEDFSSGVYYYKLQAGDFFQIRKMILLK